MEERADAQNEYIQHRKLYTLETIASEYAAGKAYTQKIQKIMREIETQQYRVAVIGEFKRGKSSMINALLGAEVLPTDILPMTAAVNRIVYGNQKGIQIHYKNGSVENAEVEDLISYATKYDSEKAMKAEKVREIVVSYPSVFCKNHIEIYDTPGLNDDESMTEITLGVLKDVDAAIVVLSATMPLSLTEQNLIIKLLECGEIHNIVFVITFIDVVSSRRSEQDKVINFMKNRIADTVLQQALSTHEDVKFQEKARRILENPTTFAVSSLLALNGFLQDDEELLEKSRFPEFKYALLEVLTAGQSLETEYKVNGAVEEVTRGIQAWYAEEENGIAKEEKRNETGYKFCIKYLDTAAKELEQIFVETDTALETRGISYLAEKNRAELAQQMRKYFIRELSSLKVGATKTDIDAAIKRAADNSMTQMKETISLFRRNSENLLKDAGEKFMQQRQEKFAGIAESLWKVSLSKAVGNNVAFPEFGWTGALYPVNLDLMNEDVISHINKRILDSITVYCNKWNDYLAGWRKAMLMQNQEDGRQRALLQERYEEKKKELQMQKEIKRHQYQKHLEKLENI